MSCVCTLACSGTRVPTWIITIYFLFLDYLIINIDPWHFPLTLVAHPCAIDVALVAKKITTTKTHMIDPILISTKPNIFKLSILVLCFAIMTILRASVTWTITAQLISKVQHCHFCHITIAFALHPVLITNTTPEVSPIVQTDMNPITTTLYLFMIIIMYWIMRMTVLAFKNFAAPMVPVALIYPIENNIFLYHVYNWYLSSYL